MMRQSDTRYDTVSARLERNQLKLATPSADIGMLPVPKKLRIHFPVVTRHSMKAEEQPAKEYTSQKQKDRDCAAKVGRRLRMIQSSPKAGQSPEERKAGR